MEGMGKLQHRDITGDALTADLSGLTDDELVNLYEEAERQAIGASLLMCKVVATYRTNHKQKRGASWVTEASTRFQKSRRNLEGYASFWDRYCEFDADVQARFPNLGGNLSLIQFIGRQAPDKGRVTALRLLSHFEAAGYLPSVKALQGEVEEAATIDHADVQYRLVRLGTQLGHEAWIAEGDQTRVMRHGPMESLRLRKRLPQLDPGNAEAQRTIARIDVLWLDPDGGYIAAFEVEKSTSIYSGILRMSDLAACAPNVNLAMFIVAQEKRRGEVIAQLNRPTFRRPPLNLHSRCRLITIETLLAKSEQASDLVHTMDSARLLDRISETCDGSNATPTDY
jgi:hypothetical protein